MAAAKQPEVAGEESDDSGEQVGGLFADINITPLTDVFLVMLVIFMLSSLAVHTQDKKKIEKQQEKIEEIVAEKRSGLKVNLPSGAAQEIDPTKASLVLVVPVNGDVVIQDNKTNKTIPDADLDNLFAAAFAKDKTMQVVIQADRGVQHGRVVNLMERAKRAGLTRLAIGTSSGGP
jgi:biopolymer transport protein ExbD